MSLNMPDSLHLSLWVRDPDLADVIKACLSAMRNFTFSSQRPGITYLSLHPVSWNEATVLERRFHPAVSPEEAVQVAIEQLHDDYAYVFEAAWDLWMPSESGKEWTLQPSTVEFIARGPDFDESSYEQEGHVEIDFGSDAPFLQEQAELTADAEAKIRANIQKLVEFSAALEKNSGASARLLWSESEENLAQKLIARLQKVQ